MSEKQSITWRDQNENKHSGSVIHTCDDGQINIIACENCGFSHVTPLPSEEELEKFYNEDFYKSEKPNYLTSSHKDYEWLKLSFGDRYDLFEQNLNVKTGRVLDIGCGPGSFLDEGKSRGWQVFGVEPSSQASQFAKDKGLNITHGAFKAEMFKGEEKFDVVHMSEVLEHVAQPKQILTDAISLLKSGGLLCISVPNDFNDFQQSLVESGEFSPWWVVPDHHLNYFNFNSLEALVKEQGLNVINRTTNFPMELFLLMGQDYTKDKDLGSQLHNSRKQFDLNLAKNGGQQARLKLYNALAEANLGRLAIITAKKP